MSSLLVTTACGAGQIAQTATQVITQEGANADRGGVALRAVLIPTPNRGTYPTGETAPLYLAISTEEGTSDTLVKVTSEAATSVVLIASPIPASPGAAASASPAASASADPSAAPEPSASPSNESASLELPDGSLIRLGQGTSYLELRGLTSDLAPGDTVSVAFSFAGAGDITLDVPVATPDTPGPRVKPSPERE